LSRARIFDRRSRTAGFTIIEALVALAVVAVSLSAIGALIATTVRGTRSIEQHAALVEVARAVEAGLPGRDQLVAGELSGELAGHRWRVDVMPFPDQGAGLGASSWRPQSIVITVRAPSGAVLRIDTVRLRREATG
jgi:general secretion pathway protein I